MATTAAPAAARPSASSRINIVIAKTSDRNEVDPVPVGVNGRTYTINRGQVAAVPPEVVEVLRNAMQTIYWQETDPMTGRRITKSREALSYPFEIRA